MTDDLGLFHLLGNEVLEVAVGDAALEFRIVFQFGAAPVDGQAGAERGEKEGRNGNQQDVDERNTVGRERCDERGGGG